MRIVLSIIDRLRFFVNRLRERLWVKPLVVGLVSIGGVFIIKAADLTGVGYITPNISLDSLEKLLSIMASSMLVIATFAVGSMVTAYASASTIATPRSFALVIADDVSQNALSTFIAAFIFSIVALIALKNQYFEQASRFTLFIATVMVLAFVIVTFLRWVDVIARLGRMGSTIDKVEEATAKALGKRRDHPTLYAVPARHPLEGARPVFATTVGYVQRVDIMVLQEFAAEVKGRISVASLPGTFVASNRPLAFIKCEDPEQDVERVIRAFVIGGKRTFEDDPRFGLVVLSQIALRSLSPAVNDPGTAIDIIGTFVRLFCDWARPVEAKDSGEVVYDLVEVQELSVQDLFDDAFAGIARDGAGMIEVASRLQKALGTLASLNNMAIREAAIFYARRALAYSEKALQLPEEISVIREIARLTTQAERQTVTNMAFQRTTNHQR